MKPFLSMFLFFMLVSLMVNAQHQMVVEVSNVASSEGKISVALYDREDAFLKFDEVFASASSKAEKGKTTVVLEDIPAGRYAIALFHDENNNDQLDTNWMGIPKEKVAFSKAKMKLFGPPSFKDCAFELNQNTKLEIIF